jgi:hypothetical protein
MKGRKFLMLMVAGVLACALVGTASLALGQQGGDVSQGPRGSKEMSVQGKIKPKWGGGYFILSSPESYNIANPNPEILAPLVKSGETATFKVLANGDLLTIETINGKKYQSMPPPAAK